MGPLDTQDLPACFDRVNVYLALGDCLGNPGLPNVGDARGAKEAYEKAKNLDQAIAAAHPDNQRAQRAVGLMEMRTGDVEMGSGDLSSALARYENAARMLENVVARDPLNPNVLLVLANVTGKVGSALESVGQTGAAMTQYGKAEAIGRRLVDADPKNEQSKNSYALSLRARATLLAKLGDTAGALALHREALEIFRQVLAADPQSARRQAVYAETLAAIGGLAANGNQEEAERAYREAMGMFKALAGRGAASLEDLSNYAEHLLTCPLKQFADPGQALAVSRRAVDLSHASQPAYLEQLARAYWATRDPAGAAATEKKALELWPESSPRRREAQAMLEKFETGGKR